ncbi:unnamed protein product [Closterium sp. NIES-64]|nr:unnamed protein product [Closterium sp. NIES-64]
MQKSQAASHAPAATSDTGAAVPSPSTRPSLRPPLSPQPPPSAHPLPSPHSPLSPPTSHSPHPPPSPRPPLSLRPPLSRASAIAPSVDQRTAKLLATSSDSAASFAAPQKAFAPGLDHRASKTLAATGEAAAPMPRLRPASLTTVPTWQPPSPTPVSTWQPPSPTPVSTWQPPSPTPITSAWQPPSPTPVRSPHGERIQRRAAEAKMRQAQMDEAWVALMLQDDHQYDNHQLAGASTVVAAAAAAAAVSPATAATPASGAATAAETQPSLSTNGPSSPSGTAPTEAAITSTSIRTSLSAPTKSTAPGESAAGGAARQSWGASWRLLMASGRSLKGRNNSFTALREGDSNKYAAGRDESGSLSDATGATARPSGGAARGVVASLGGRRRMCRSLSLSDGLLAAVAAAAADGTGCGGGGGAAAAVVVASGGHSIVGTQTIGADATRKARHDSSIALSLFGSSESSHLSTCTTRASDHPAFQPLLSLDAALGPLAMTKTLSDSNINVLTDSQDPFPASPFGHSALQGSSPECSVIYSCAIPSPSPEVSASTSQSARLERNHAKTTAAARAAFLTAANIPSRADSPLVNGFSNGATATAVGMQVPLPSAGDSSPESAIPCASLPRRSLSSSSVLSSSAPLLAVSPLAIMGENGTRPRPLRKKVSFNSIVRVRTFISTLDIEPEAAPVAC